MRTAIAIDAEGVPYAFDAFDLEAGGVPVTIAPQAIALPSTRRAWPD